MKKLTIGLLLAFVFAGGLFIANASISHDADYVKSVVELNDNDPAKDKDKDKDKKCCESKECKSECKDAKEGKTSADAKDCCSKDEKKSCCDDKSSKECNSSNSASKTGATAGSTACSKKKCQ